MNAILALILSMCALLMSCTAMANRPTQLPTTNGDDLIVVHVTNCNDPAPPNPSKGDIWLALCNNGKETRMYLWDGKAWLKVDDEPEFSA